MKGLQYIQICPIRHRTDHGDRRFIYLFAYWPFWTISFEIEIESPSDRYSIFEVVSALETLHKIYLYYGSNTNKYAIQPKMTKSSKEISFEVRP